MRPGEFRVILGGPLDALWARQAGFQVRDTLLVLLPGRRVLTAFLCRRPLEGTVAENVLKHGVGGLWIDGCRVGYGGKTLEEVRKEAGSPTQGTKKAGRVTNFGMGDHSVDFHPSGRWPSNLLLVHGPGCRRVGERAVRGSGKDGPQYQKLGRKAATYAQDDWTRHNGRRGTSSYVSSDGLETVPDWECQEDCPVRMMDEQTGVTTNTRHMSYQRSGEGFIGKIADAPERRWWTQETGTASRFYPQFSDLASALDWLVRLVNGPS